MHHAEAVFNLKIILHIKQILHISQAMQVGRYATGRGVGKPQTDCASVLSLRTDQVETPLCM